MDTKSSLISVLIATYNRAPYLERAVKSVLRQTYHNMEIIIVDDCSSDNTKDMVEQLRKASKNTRIKYFRNEANRKFGYTINKAAQQAEGEFLAILGDDDEWCNENKLKLQFEMLEQNSHRRIGAVCTGFRYMNGNDKKILRTVVPVKVASLEESILTGNYFLSSTTVLIPKKVWEDLEGMDLNIPRGVDSDFFRKLIVKHHYEVLTIPDVMANVYVDSPNRMTPHTTIAANEKSINAIQYTLEKFQNEFAEYPKALSKRYLQLARHAYNIYILDNNNEFKLKAQEYIKKSLKSHFSWKVLAINLAFKIPGFNKYYQQKTLKIGINSIV